MLKRIASIVCCFVFLFAFLPAASAAEADTSSLLPYEIYVNDTLVADAGATGADQTVSVSLTALAAALYPEASMEWTNSTLTISASELTITVRESDSYLCANGRYLYAPEGIRKENGVLLVPMRTAARALNAGITWGSQTVWLESGEETIQSGETYYDAALVDLLSRVIHNESGNQPMKGQIAVGNVLLNRVASSLFPDTLDEVITQPGQFPGTTRYPGDDESTIAAKLCLDGAVVLGNALWFNGAGKSCWASQNKTLLATIGNQSFYG